jgi:hypothetical protein
MERVYGKEQRQGSDSLFATTKLFHISKAFHGWHGVELHSSKVGFLRIVQAQVRTSSQWMFATFSHVGVDCLQGLVDVIESSCEPLVTLALDLLKLRNSFSGSLLCLIEICPTFLQLLGDGGKRVMCLTDNIKQKIRKQE